MGTIAVDPQPAIDPASEQPFRVGRASVDPASRDAAFAGHSERLGRQNLRVLIALARQRGKLVTRDQLVNLCWDGRFVGDDVINRAISTLRQFAGRAGGFSIETVPRAGYRLVESPPSRGRRAWLVIALIGIFVAATSFVFTAWPKLRGEPAAPTIAILPFSTASADPLERELASDARDALAQTLFRTDFHVALADKAPQSGNTRPDFVASAEVSSNPVRVAVAVHVTDVEHNIVVYSHRFEAKRSDSRDLPEQIAAQIAGSVGWTASLLMLERNHPADPAITARLFDESDSFAEARKLAPRYPDSPIAQIALAYGVAYGRFDAPPDERAAVAAIGRHAAERARILAPRFGGNEILWCLFHSRARIKECEDHLRAGLDYDPGSPWITNFLGDRLKDVGRTSEALRFANDSWSHDPYQMQKIGLLLRMFEANGKSREAESLYTTAKREWPDDPVLFWERVYGILDRGDFDALSAFWRSAPSDLVPQIQSADPVVRAVKANHLADARKLCPSDQVPSFKRDVCTLALARLGDAGGGIDIALGTYPDRIGRTPADEERLWLQSARFGDTDILMGPAAAPLRRDPRYVELARRLGALDYWRSGRLPDFCRRPKPETLCMQMNVSH